MEANLYIYIMLYPYTTLSRTTFHTQLFHTQLRHTYLFHAQTEHTNFHTHNSFTHTHTPLSHINSFTRKLSHTHTTLSAFPILLSHLFCAYWKKLTYGVLRSFNFAGFHHSFGSPKWCVLGPPWSTVVLRGERWTQPLAGCLASASRWGRPETPRWGTQILADA